MKRDTEEKGVEVEVGTDAERRCVEKWRGRRGCDKGKRSAMRDRRRVGMQRWESALMKEEGGLWTGRARRRCRTEVT